MAVEGRLRPDASLESGHSFRREHDELRLAAMAAMAEKPLVAAASKPALRNDEMVGILPCMQRRGLWPRSTSNLTRRAVKRRQSERRTCYPRLIAHAHWPSVISDGFASRPNSADDPFA